MPNDPRDEPHDSHDNVRVHRYLEHPGDTVRVQHIARPISLLIEERGRLIRAGHEQLDVITDVASIECTEPSQAVNAGFWSRLFLLLGEDISKPLLSSLEVLFVFVVKPNQEAKDEGEWGLEWAVVGKGGGGNNEEVQKGTERGETDDDAGNDFVDGEEVVGKSITEEEGGLEHEG